MIDCYIKQYGRRLYGLCLTLCANVSDADDLYQETWLKVLKNIACYDIGRDFEPWLTRICVNIYRNSLRRLVRSPIWDGFATSKDKSAALESIPAPIAEDFSDLHCAIDSLPEKLRLAVILYYFRGMDQAAAAQVLDVPVGTVKSRLNKAKKLLKEALTYEPL